MTKAKVTQAEADAYLDGWGAYHNGQSVREAINRATQTWEAQLVARFMEGYDDCAAGILNFDKMMGPNDL